MKFTVEVRSGLCNVLKSFATALSMGEANVLPNLRIHFDADYREILDDSLICHGSHEFGESFISARLLILKSEEQDQPDLINDAKALGSHPDIVNKKLAPLFSTHTVDWFYDRKLICDKVYNRIQSGIQKIKWRSEVLSEVERVSKDFEGPTLAVQVRTWAHPFDPPNCTSIRDGVTRGYNFETYKKAIDEFIPKAKTVFVTADREDVLQDYINYFKDYDVKVVTYNQPPGVTQMQYSAATMLAASKCNMLVCSRLSTFAECIWWFGKCAANVIPVF
tara:strand:- start:4774 stop:5604 length:831 start_codon:yes stop_codon:yes gene_type:complete